MSKVVIANFAIPEERLDLYKKLLLLFSKYGEEALKDCTSVDSKNNINLVTCWNMFNAATDAYTLNEYKKANLIYDYIDKQLPLIYTNTEIYKDLDKVINFENWEEYEC